MGKLQLTGLIVLAIIIVLVITAAGYARQKAGLPEYDTAALAHHLTDTGVKVYGTFWCSACKAQKELFGEAWQYAPYVECSDTNGEQLEVCKAEKIEGYPTWVFPDGTRHAGMLSLEELAEAGNFRPTFPVPADGS